MWNSGVLTIALIILLTGLIGADSLTAEDRNAIRLDLKQKAVSDFSKNADHCRSFVSVIKYALGKATNVSDLLEDLKLVIIGDDWRRRKGMRGPYYMDFKTTDSGFKEELKDSSPQVEHAMAAIYLAKILPPGGVGANGSFLELLEAVGRKDKPNGADMLLFMYGEDLGDRLANNNMGQFPTAVERTLCK